MTAMGNTEIRFRSPLVLPRCGAASAGACLQRCRRCARKESAWAQRARFERHPPARQPACSVPFVYCILRHELLCTDLST
eukprot:6197451-Pleurochrysis_carterae.AAC.3